MSTQNPVFATDFPKTVDPPLPPTSVTDQNLLDRFDTQIRALQQVAVAAGSTAIYGGVFTTSQQTIAAPGSSVYAQIPFGSVYAANANATAFANAVTVLAPGAIEVSASVSVACTGGVESIGLRLYKNGVQIGAIDGAAEVTTSGANAFAFMRASSLVIAAAGDVFTAWIVSLGGASTLEVVGNLMVMNAGNSQGLQGPQGAPGTGGGGGSAQLPTGTTDTAGGAVTITVNTATWNRSAASSQNTYMLPTDTTNWPHIISWQSGVAPSVTAPAGWKIMNPVTGVLTATGGTFLYGTGGNTTGETYAWSSDVTDQIFWAQ